MEVLEFLFRGLVAAIIGWFLLWLLDCKIVKKANYSFECTVCDFKASSNSLETVNFARVCHTHKLVEEK